MSSLKIERKELLKMIQNHEISPEDGLAFLKKFDASFTDTDIAIVGMSCRCADALDDDEFWDHIEKKSSLMERKKTEKGDVYTCGLPEKYCFDNEFFHISPKEAMLMDPQQRVFLEESWKALENAGYSEDMMKGAKCGVFVGVSHGDYEKQVDKNGYCFAPETTTSLSASVLASRLSYYLDLNGPALAVDTACSSSAVALHYAIHSILADDCDMAVVGGAAILTSDELLIKSAIISMTSPNGKCAAFADSADGTVFADGVNAIVIKRLSDAEKNGDMILGVIKATAVNSNGKTNGLTAPSAKSQSALIRELYRSRNIDPCSVSYIETHGTGTPLGDPIEFRSLKEIFDNDKKKNYCALGSCKSVIGHTMAASGIFNVISVIQALQHETIPPIANYGRTNPRIDLENSAFYISDTAKKWESSTKRLAAVDSFGFSGTNAHILIGEADKRIGLPAVQDRYFIPVSAKTEGSLKENVSRLARYLTGAEDSMLPDIEYTLTARRNHFRCRACFIASDIRSLVCAMNNYPEGQADEPCSDDAMLDSVRRRFLSGDRISYSDFRSEKNVRNIFLPSYAFERNEFCVGEAASDELQRIRDSVHAVEDYCVRRLTVLVNELGLFEGSDRTELDDFRKRIGLIPKYDRLFHRMLMILDEYKVIRLSKAFAEKLEGFDDIISECGEKKFSALFAEITKRFPDTECQLTLADMCFKSYADMLCGRIDSVQVMFPDGDVSYVEAIYKNNAIAEYFNGRLADTVAEELISSGRKLRILEIGAGTGSSTAAVLCRSDITDRIEEYCFTDISAKFLNYGESEFGKKYPFMKFEILNIEDQPKAPFKSGSFDIIIATNVLHATHKIKNTLKNSAYLLADGGKIMINEVVRYNLFSDLTFGTLDGWWMFDDPENRMEGTPVLSPEKWSAALTDCGFDDVCFKCDDACNSYDMKQNVITAVRRIKEKKKAGKKVNIVSEVTAVIAQKLMIAAEKIQPKQMFRDYGLDSITSVDVVNELNRRFGISLRATDIFKYANVETFSEHISSLYKEPEADSESGSAEQNAADASVCDDADDKIAVVGISARYAGVNDLSDYWEVIKNAKDNVKEITRWESDSFFDPNPDNKSRSYSKWCGMMDNIFDFDNKFFGIINREAELMDPEHRIFLEEAYHAFEDAGYTREMLSGKNCGVYIGCGGSCYDDNIRNAGRNDDAYVFTGNIPSVLPARISYFLNLRGPAIAVNTACSSSLVAIHLAFQSILSGENDIALAGGISLLSNPDFYILTSRGNMLSPTGKCWAFDSRADGFVPGEGIGLLVLKKLSQAQKDGDYIYGIIKGSGMNQDGKSNGITSPNADAQTALEKEVYSKYNINVNDIGYIEAHGTGTKLGDPIEIDALNDAFTSATDRKGYCALGSVKSNIGHSMAAAGAAGVIKSLMVLKKKIIPPLCNFSVLNPYLDLDDSPFYIPKESKEWETENNAKRLSAVSSFGISGTNVHMVLEEYEDEVHISKNESRLFVLSSGTAKTLSEYSRRLAKWIGENEGISLDDAAYTLAVRRDHYPCRAAITASDRDTLLEKLARLAEADSAGGYSDIDADAPAELRKAADSFLNDRPVEWSGICSGRNLPLPGYVFDRRTFTVDKVPSSEYVLSECDWIPADDALTPSDTSGDIMIIYSGSQKQLAEELKSSIADSFVLMNCIDEIREDTADHVLSLMGSKPVTVVDLCDVNKNSPYADRLKLIQKMIVNKGLCGLRYLHITCRLENFSIGGSCSVNGSVMSSFAKTLGDEYKRISSVTADCNTDSAVCECAGRLLRSSWKCGSLCFRNGRFYEAAEKQVNLPFASDNVISAGIGGTVLITGAFGGIGRFLVRKLAQIGYRRFALFCRTPAAQLTGEKKALLDFLEAWDLKYMIYSGSITDREALHDFTDNVKHRLGEITGVIHLAGNSDNSEFAFIKKNIDKMEDVFEPKIRGTELLFDAVDSLSLKYFVMFSSVSAVYSKLSVGISTYAAANAYLNSFAQSKFTSGDHRVRSICWSDWNVNGIGKADTRVLWDMGFRRLEPDKAFELMLSAISVGNLPVIIATRRIGFKAAPLSRREAAADVKASVKMSEIHSLNDLTAAKKLLLEIFAEEMKMSAEEIPLDKTFTEIGMDSIILSEIIKSIERKCGITVDPNIMFEYQTIDQLSVKINELIPTDITANKQETVPNGLSKADYRDAIVKVLAEELRMDVSEIRFDESFAEMGVDSIVLAEIVKNMERSFNTVIDPNILLEYSSPEKLTDHFFNFRMPISGTGKEASAAFCGPSAAEYKTDDHEPHTDSDNTVSGRVAVIGIACHFPGASDKEEFWKNLVDGVDSVTEIPPERWSIDEFYSPENAKGKTNSKYGGFIKGIEDFDPEYFGFKKADGVKFDPLIRQFLEVSAEAINDAGYTKKDIWGKNAAVYAGARTGGYTAMSGDFEKNTILGTGQNFIAAHVSHVFNLTGASMTVDSACSSSLSAVHLAFNSLVSGESELAVAGGVDILLNEEPYLIMGSCGALSPDGKCKTFDVSANGFVPGEGCGAVILKRYEDAVSDGDHIYAVIEASAINNDGNTMGVTTPNPEAQKKVICNAIEKSGIDPRNIAYIEAHGTGTLIGDPIELKSLTNVFSQYTDKKQYCAVGSVKTNIGHLLSASGIASFIKCCLIAENKYIPKTLNCVNVNPRFNFESSPFYPELEGEAYSGGKMTVGVSSFGFGGTNVHQLISSCENSVPRKNLPPIVFNRERYWNDDYKSRYASAKANKEPSLFHLEPEIQADSAEETHGLFTIELSEG